MIFSLEVLPASEGDCMLLHWGAACAPRIAVIDGGPGRTYENTLRPRLHSIAANRRVEQLELDLVMVSHADNDHVVGIQKLTRELKQQIEQNVPPRRRLVRMARLWHNIFNDVLGDGIDAYYNTLTTSFQASAVGEPAPVVIEKLANAFQIRQGSDAGTAREDAMDIAKILAGHNEGREVRDNHRFLFGNNQVAQLNRPFQGPGGHATLITAEKTGSPVIIEDLEFTIYGPMKAEIEALQKEFDKFIKDRGLAAEAVLAAYADKSIKNLSSIVFIAKAKNGRTMLLTGDARGDKILEGLGLTSPGRTLAVDILKVPHHGSNRNVTGEFFEKIIADNYVFSGNGKHGNPDRDTLEWLAKARGKNARYQIVLTYPAQQIDKTAKDESERDGKPWIRQKHSIEDFISDCAAQGFQFDVHAGRTLVELGDERVTW